MLRLASVLLVCVLLSTSAISGTFAKYTSTVTATDSARVAKWSIVYTDVTNSAAGVDITGSSPSITFDLFNTVAEDESPTGTDDTEVKNGTDETIIAPGTGGKFDLSITNESEVAAKFTIELSASNENNIPIEYSLDGTTWSSDITTLEVVDIPLTMDESGNSRDVSVYWRWTFEEGTPPGRDPADTALGVAAQITPPAVTVTATIIATQVD